MNHGLAIEIRYRDIVYLCEHDTAQTMSEVSNFLPLDNWSTVRYEAFPTYPSLYHVDSLCSHLIYQTEYIHHFVF